MATKMRRSGITVVLAAVVAVGLAGCDKAGADKASLPAAAADGATIGVRVVKPETQLGAGLVQAIGKLQAKRSATLSSKVSGTIQKFHVDVGSVVKQGDPLVQLDATSAGIAVSQARAARDVAAASLQAATQDVERARKLAVNGGLAQAGLDRAEAGFKQATAAAAQADAALRGAQKAYADHTIRAPFPGTITARTADVGEYVAVMPATAILGLVDLDALEVVVPVPETVISAIQPGTKITAVVNPSGKAFDAEVTVVGSVVDPQSRTVEVRAVPVGDRIPEMRPQAMVQVDFSKGQSLAGLFLPGQAVRREGDGWFVWVVEGDAVVRKAVKAEKVSPEVVRILEGLNGGEQVVGDAGGSLREGMRVRVIG